MIDLKERKKKIQKCHSAIRCDVLDALWRGAMRWWVSLEEQRALHVFKIHFEIVVPRCNIWRDMGWRALFGYVTYVRWHYFVLNWNYTGDLKYQMNYLTITFCKMCRNTSLISNYIQFLYKYEATAHRITLQLVTIRHK
jgi:hypothetical protein